jgi:N-glycosylase/DNA lyase
MTMTPKLYEEVNTKLVSVWGDYAGWAHSVRFPLPSFLFTRVLSLLKVMFTADLKSFADHNATPSSSPQKKVPTPKRKREDRLKDDEILPTPPLTPEVETGSLAERVKRRRGVK